MSNINLSLVISSFWCSFFRLWYRVFGIPRKEHRQQGRKRLQRTRIWWNLKVCGMKCRTFWYRFTLKPILKQLFELLFLLFWLPFLHRIAWWIWRCFVGLKSMGYPRYQFKLCSQRFRKDGRDELDRSLGFQRTTKMISGNGTSWTPDWLINGSQVSTAVE